MSPGRREFLLGGGSLGLLAACAPARRAGPGSRQLRVTVTGQALMTHTLCVEPYAGFDAVVAEIRRGDVAFTGLEAAVRTPASGAPTREGTFLHVAPAEVPACLRAMGFHLAALANNHAYDLGSAGILATRDAVAAAGLGHAGTGANLAEATAPGYTPGGPRIALVAMAIERIREGGAATAERPGVNEVRMQDGAPAEDDVARVLVAIRAAAAQAPRVIVYLSNHAWEGEPARTKPWAQRLARRCVDAGATIYVTHGAPMMQGIEAWRGRPIFHGLGSLVFHSRTAPGHYPPEVWESAIVHCDLADDRPVALEVVPVVLNERGDDPTRQNETRGRPRIAAGAERARILARIAAMSAGLEGGVVLDPASGRARLAAA